MNYLRILIVLVGMLHTCIVQIHAQWTSIISENHVVTSAAGDQWQGFYTKSSLCSDGSGGALVTWYNNAVPYEIWSARLNQSGGIVWTSKLCSGIGTTTRQNPVIISDGAGGAIVSWQDWRDSTVGGTQDIFAARLGSDGSLIWGDANGIAIASGGTNTGNKYYPVMCSDGAGGAIVTWQAQVADGEIFARKVSANGQLSWGSQGGLAVCTVGGNQLNPAIVSDGNGGAVIAWADQRNGNTNQDIYAKRLGSDGSTLWGGQQGLAVSEASGNQSGVVITTDGSQGAIVAWLDGRGSFGIGAQRVNSTGTVQWTADGIPVTSLNNNEDLSIVSDSAGGAFFTWNTGANQQGSNSGPQNIYAQHINTAGNATWTANGLVVCNQAGTQWRAASVASKQGGLLTAWGDYRGSSGYSDIFIQKIDSAGNFVWSQDGVQVSSANCSQGGGRVSLLNDGCDGAILSWMDRRNASNCGMVHDIYAQYINPEGIAGGVSGNCSQALTAGFTKTDASCEQAADGSATITPAGGSGPYVIVWDTNPVQTGNTANGLRPGNYSATVTDAGSSSVVLNINIGFSATYDAGIIEATLDTVCAGNEVQLSISGNSHPVQWWWSADGNAYVPVPDVSGESISILLDESRYFKVTVGENDCQTYSDEYRIVYSETPAADFTFSRIGAEISFKDNSTGDIAEYRWTYGDESTGTGSSPLHNYPSEGRYKACLEVENTAGCVDSVCKWVEVIILEIHEQATAIESVFPNPFVDQIVLRIQPGIRNCQMRLSDLRGRLILEKTLLGQEVLFLPELEEGIYLLTMNTGGKNSVIPLIKAR